MTVFTCNWHCISVPAERFWFSQGGRRAEYDTLPRIGPRYLTRRVRANPRANARSKFDVSNFVDFSSAKGFSHATNQIGRRPALRIELACAPAISGAQARPFSARNARR